MVLNGIDIEIERKPIKNLHLAVYPSDGRVHVSVPNVYGEEVSYIDSLTTCHSRSDIVVYVNGIALCVIELKRSIVSLEEGIRPYLSNESDLISSFFGSLQDTFRPSGSPDRQGAGAICRSQRGGHPSLVVEKKWMRFIQSSCMEEMQQVTQQLSAASPTFRHAMSARCPRSKQMITAMRTK